MPDSWRLEILSEFLSPSKGGLSGRPDNKAATDPDSEGGTP
jgi:hypothetical protein